MVNKIQEILNRYNMTAAKLADQLEIPRSTISHILTGRNKPSLEFTQKLLQKFPEISTDWLIKGEGTMNRVQQDLFSNIAYVDNDETKENQVDVDIVPKKYPPEVSPELPDTNADKKDENLRRVKDESSPDETSEIHLLKDENSAEIKRKKIIKIITFYSDDTFDEYFPSKKQD
jgi:transcriptional regulator with XRE-family HTH domain